MKKKNSETLSSSPLITKLLKSGTGVIEGNYKSGLGIEDIELSNEEDNFSVHFSDFFGNYLGEYYVIFSKPKKRLINCELLIGENKAVYNPLAGFGDSIHIVLLPFKNSLGGYAGRFIADWGGPTVDLNEEDLD
jgi:hypothetical protein